MPGPEKGGEIIISNMEKLYSILDSIHSEQIELPETEKTINQTESQTPNNENDLNFLKNDKLYDHLLKKMNMDKNAVNQFIDAGISYSTSPYTYEDIEDISSETIQFKQLLLAIDKQKDKQIAKQVGGHNIIEYQDKNGNHITIEDKTRFERDGTEKKTNYTITMATNNKDGETIGYVTLTYNVKEKQFYFSDIFNSIDDFPITEEELKKKELLNYIASILEEFK